MVSNLQRDRSSDPSTTSFVATDDPYFYDVADRPRKRQAMLAEEVLWEEEIADGITELSLEAWLAERDMPDAGPAIPGLWPLDVSAQ